MALALALAAAVVLACTSPAAAFSTESTWTDARATFYGRDAWALHTGSCGFGFICPNRWSGELAQGMDVTAVSDRSDLYGHCGECLEVKCRSASIPAGGSTLDRTGLCLSDKSVKVKIVDTCPCVYPNKAASNKLWCCGDFPHLDLSQWALEKIASDTERWGVFAISYRKVDCSLAIPATEEAPAFADAAPDPHANMKPAGLNCVAAARQALRKAVVSSKAQSKRAAQTTAQSVYWRQWWDTFQTYSFAKKRGVYQKIWDRIRAGELTRAGHGKP